jgi:hypothetical protein
MLRKRARGTPDMLLRENRHRLVFERREIVHPVVERLQRAVPGVEQHLAEPALLGLAGEEGDAERLCFAQLGWHLGQHREAAGDVKAAETDRQPGLQERPRQIDGAGKLVGLDADQPDQRAAASAADPPDDPVGPHPSVGLVIGLDANLDPGTQHMPLPQILGQAVQGGQRIGWYRRPEPLDRIAVIVVMARLDQHELKKRGRGARHCSLGGSIAWRDRDGTSLRMAVCHRQPFPSARCPAPAQRGLADW